LREIDTLVCHMYPFTSTASIVLPLLSKRKGKMNGLDYGPILFLRRRARVRNGAFL
jgi:hypothetical protein